MKYLSKWCLSLLILANLLFVICGCSTYRHSNILSKSHKKAIDAYTKDIQSALNRVKSERELKGTKILIDSAINIMLESNESDTIYIVECCNRPGYVYGASIWDKSKSYFITHYLDIFEIYNKDWIDYRLKDLISKWNLETIASKSYAHPQTYYISWNMFEIATRLIYERGKIIESETIIYRIINFDDETIPGYLD